MVWEGAKIGVFESWGECKKSIHGFKGAKYKSFKTFDLAKKAFSENYDNYEGKDIFENTHSEKQFEDIGKPIIDSVSVDAACSRKEGKVEYQCIDNSTHMQYFYFGPLYQSTNNIGEFLALVHALAYMKLNNDDRPIYTDSKTAMSWVKRKMCNTKLLRNDKNARSFELLDRAIKWLIENDFRNEILKWETKAWGEIPADFGRK